MDKVRIQNIKTKAIELVKKELAGDYIGTGEWILVSDTEEQKENKGIFTKEEK